MRNAILVFFTAVAVAAIAYFAAMESAPAQEACSGASFDNVMTEAVVNGFDVVQYTGERAKAFVEALEEIIGQAPADLIREKVMVVDGHEGVYLVALGGGDCAQYRVRLDGHMLGFVITGMQKRMAQ